MDFYSSGLKSMLGVNADQSNNIEKTAESLGNHSNNITHSSSDSTAYLKAKLGVGMKSKIACFDFTMTNSIL